MESSGGDFNIKTFYKWSRNCKEGSPPLRINRKRIHTYSEPLSTDYLTYIVLPTLQWRFQANISLMSKVNTTRERTSDWERVLGRWYILSFPIRRLLQYISSRREFLFSGLPSLYSVSEVSFGSWVTVGTITRKNLRLGGRGQVRSLLRRDRLSNWCRSTLWDSVLVGLFDEDLRTGSLYYSFIYKQ